MTKTTMILIGATVLSAFVAWNAFADTQNVSGANNTALQNADNNFNNGIINSAPGAGSTTTTTNTATASPTVHVTDTVIAAPITHNDNDSKAVARTGDVAVDTPISINTKVPKQTASAYAPALTNSFGNDSCLGSLSGGLSSGIIGATLGGSTVDENCKMLKNSERADRKGYHKAALYILCQNSEFRSGMQFEKEKCPQDEQQASSPALGKEYGKLSPASKQGFPSNRNRFE
ncbi:MAG: hypothetical protein V4493_03015 [Pseudomonadota bacterium]